MLQHLYLLLPEDGCSGAICHRAMLPPYPITNVQLLYLAQLLAMKREEREKQLAEAERSQQGKSRPKSARAARSSFGGKKAAATAAADGDAVARGIDPETLRVRRALAQKLKSEVIGKS